MTSPPPTQKPSYAASASKSSTPSSPQPLNVKKPAITTSVPPTSATIAPAPFNYASIAAKHSSTKPSSNVSAPPVQLPQLPITKGGFVVPSPTNKIVFGTLTDADKIDEKNGKENLGVKKVDPVMAINPKLSNLQGDFPRTMSAPPSLKEQEAAKLKAEADVKIQNQDNLIPSPALSNTSISSSPHISHQQQQYTPPYTTGAQQHHYPNRNTRPSYRQHNKYAHPGQAPHSGRGGPLPMQQQGFYYPQSPAAGYYQPGYPPQQFEYYSPQYQNYTGPAPNYNNNMRPPPLPQSSTSSLSSTATTRFTTSSQASTTASPTLSSSSVTNNPIMQPSPSKAIKIVNPDTKKPVEFGTPQKSSAIKITKPNEPAGTPTKPVAVVNPVILSTPTTPRAAITLRNPDGSPLVIPSKKTPKAPVAVAPTTSLVDEVKKAAVHVLEEKKPEVVVQKKVEPIAVVKKVEPVVVEKKVEPVAVVKKVEPVVVEKKVESVMVEKKVEPVAVSEKVKSAVVAKKTEPVLVEKKIEEPKTVSPTLKSSAIPEKSSPARSKSPSKSPKPPMQEEPKPVPVKISEKDAVSSPTQSPSKLSPSSPLPTKKTMLSEFNPESYPSGTKLPVRDNGKLTYSIDFMNMFKDIAFVKPDNLDDSSVYIGGSSDSLHGGVKMGGRSSSGRDSRDSFARGGNDYRGDRGAFGSLSSRDRERDMGNMRRSDSRSGPINMDRKQNRSGRGRDGRESRDSRSSRDTRGFSQNEPAPPPLVISANAWRPIKKGGGAKNLTSEESILTEIGRSVTAVLNKLAPEKFDKLSDQILNVGISNEGILKVVIDKIFDKALIEAHYCGIYAQLCLKLSTELPKIQKWIDIDLKNNVFRRILLNKCQEEFEQGSSWAAEELVAREQERRAAELTDQEKADYLIAKEKRIKTKIRALGNVSFIGELFKLNMLTEKIMHICVKNMLRNVVDPEEEEIESLCKLLVTIGAKLENNTAAKSHMDAYFMRIKELSINKKLPSRIRFMLLDVIDMRANKWRARTVASGPKKLAEVRQEVEKKQQQALMDRNSRNPSSGRRDMPNLRDQFRSNSSRGGNTRQSTQDARFSNPDGWNTVSRTPSTGPSGSYGKPGGDSGNVTSLAGKTDRNNLVFGPGKSTGTGSRNVQGWTASNSSSASSSPASTSKKEPSNMFDILDSSEEQKKAPEPEPKAEKLSQEDAEKKISGLIGEWFGLFDLKEVCISIEEIGSDYHSLMLRKLLDTLSEKKVTEAKKVTDMLVSILNDEQMLDPSDLIQGFTDFMEEFEDLAIDIPGIYKVMGVVIGELELASALKMTDVVQFMTPLFDSSTQRLLGEVFSYINNSGEEKEYVVQLCEDFDLKKFWIRDDVFESDRFSSWLDKYQLEFLGELPVKPDSSDDVFDKEVLENILKGLGESSAEELVSSIKDAINVDARSSPEFISILTAQLLSYLSELPNLPDDAREAYMIKSEEVAKYAPLLSEFINEGSNEEELKVHVVSSCQKYCTADPKSINAGSVTEDMFRMFYKSDIFDAPALRQWREREQGNLEMKGVLKSLDKWYKSLDVDDPQV